MDVSPFYRFYRRVDFPLPWKTWEKLPRHPSYKNEYWDGQVHWTPRPKTCDCYLDLTTWRPPAAPIERTAERDRVTIRPLRDVDWPELADTFLRAFGNQPPLSSWGEHASHRAARCIMEWTRLGRDGAIVRGACRTAWGSAWPGEQRDRIVGAAIVTLVPVGHLTGAPAESAVPHPEHAEMLVLPHLNWIFVDQWMRRRGVGTGLLQAATCGLTDAGFKRLASTTLPDNPASMQWHWRNGFTLPPDPLSPRRHMQVAADVETSGA